MRGIRNFEYLDRMAWHRAGRPAELGPFFRTARLRLSPLPALAAHPRTALRERALEHEHTIRRDRADAKRGVLGLRRLATTDPFGRPAQPKRSRRPYCFATTSALRVEHYRQHRALHAAFDAALAHDRARARDVPFPTGTYPPMSTMAA